VEKEEKEATKASASMEATRRGETPNLLSAGIKEGKKQAAYSWSKSGGKKGGLISPQQQKKGGNVPISIADTSERGGEVILHCSGFGKMALTKRATVVLFRRGRRYILALGEEGINT